MTATRTRVLAVVGAAAVIGITAHVLYPRHHLAAVVIDDSAQLAAGLAATLSCWWFGRKAQGRERYWRWLLAAGFAGWTVGMLIWSWYQVFGGDLMPSPSWADAGYLTLPVFALAALLMFTKRSQPRPVLVLDGLVLVGSLFMLAWATALGAVVKGGAPSTGEFVVAIAYPLSDLVLVAIVALLIVFRRIGPQDRPGLLELGLGLIALSVSDSFFAYLVSRGAEDMPPLLNIGFIAGPALVAVAAAARSRSRVPDKVPSRSRPSELLYLLLPYAPLAATGILIFTKMIMGTRLDWVETYVGLMVIGMVVVRQLITLLENRLLLERVRQGQAQLEYQAYHDPLTGLANRARFHDRLAAAVEVHRREHRQVGLLFVDLDDFKLVNDSLGHAAGDSVLCGVSERLQACASGVDTVARLGGDEFAMLLDGTVEPQEVGERVLTALRQPFQIGGRQVIVSASIGAVITDTSEPDLTADALLRRVDAAMYGGKQAGKGVITVYRKELVGLDHPDLPTFLAAALRGEPDAGQLRVHYQPIVHMSNGQTVAVEALARWKSPVLGSVPPQVFVAAAERSGLIAELDDQVLDIACRDTAALIGNGGSPLRVHVNISASRLGCPYLEETIRQTLIRHGLPGDRLVLEITETSQIPDLNAAADSTRRLRQLGVKLALDDFGTGYNTLAHLHALPVDIVKLDHSLTTHTDEQERTEALGRSVVSISHALGISVIAEGVETQAQVGRLMRWGCHLGQGYLYGRSMPVAALEIGYPAAREHHVSEAGAPRISSL